MEALEEAWEMTERRDAAKRWGKSLGGEVWCENVVSTKNFLTSLAVKRGPLTSLDEAGPRDDISENHRLFTARPCL